MISHIPKSLRSTSLTWVILISLLLFPGCGEDKVDTTLGSVLYQRTVLHAETVLSTGLGPHFADGFKSGLNASTDDPGRSGVSREEAAYVTGFLRARELMNAENQDEATQFMKDINALIDSRSN